MRMRRELAACERPEDRARLGLSKLLELTASEAGCLFGVRANYLVPLATLGRVDTIGELAQRLQNHLQRRELSGPEDTPLIDAQGSLIAPQALEVAGGADQHYWALAITNPGGAIVALAAISSRADLLSLTVLDLLAALGDALFCHAEVDAFDAFDA